MLDASNFWTETQLREKAGRAFGTNTELREIKWPESHRSFSVVDDTLHGGLTARKSDSQSRSSSISDTVTSSTACPSDFTPATLKNRFPPKFPTSSLIQRDLPPKLFNLGCHLKSANCEIPLWVYRGWTAPPCCRRTLRSLLFYITAFFDRPDVGIRYVITDGALLGALKYGRLIHWDADIDL